MRITQLHVSDFKGISAVEITPDGTLVPIVGTNGAGKSSVLDAIAAALGGGAALKGTTKPIREGADRAEIVVEVEGLTVKRTFTAKGTALSVSSADGSVHVKPQEMLDRLCSKLTFDPFTFLRMNDKKQREALLNVVDIDIDLDEHEAKRQDLYDDRTSVGREVKRLEGALASFGEVEQVDRVSVSELATQLSAAQGNNREGQRLEAAIASARQKIADLTEQLERAEMELEDLAINERPDPIDEAPILAAMADADTINTQAEQWERAQQAQAELDEVKERHSVLDNEIKALDEKKAQALAAARMPVDGLSVDAEQVFVGSIPFAQVNAAEKLRISAAIAMAGKPDVRVMLVRDGSLIDENTMRLLAEIAEEHDFQVWIEIVSNDANRGILIEDGRVVDSAAGDANGPGLAPQTGGVDG